MNDTRIECVLYLFVPEIHTRSSRIVNYEQKRPVISMYILRHRDVLDFWSLSTDFVHLLRHMNEN